MDSLKYMHHLPLKVIAPFLSFIIPSLIRAVPEVLMGPYVIGFDTIAHYVPTTLLWLKGDVSFFNFLGTAPLFYSIIVSLVSFGSSLVIALKMISIVFEGLLGLSIYALAQKGLNWSPKKSMATAFLATLYFVALRVSLDSLRNMLGLVFLFLALTVLALSERKGYSKARCLLLSLSTVAVVLSHQLVTVIMLGIFALTIGYKLLRQEHTIAKHLILVCLPSISLFLAIFFLVPSVPEFRLIFGFSNSSDGWLALFGFSSYPAMLLNEAGFFVFCFLPILPFLFLEIRHLKNLQLQSWILLTLGLLFVPMVSPSNLRWLLMLTFPLSFFVIEALSRLKSVSWKRFRCSLRRIAVIYLALIVLIFSLGFIFMTPQNPFPYFAKPINGYIYQIPTSMQQNTVSTSDCSDTVSALQWLNGNMNDNAVLLTHRAFYGWAMLTINANQITLYEYDNPANAANRAAQHQNTSIYLIWWVNGDGWYGQPNVPSCFKEVHRNGEIAIYQFLKS